jgi:sn-glycerol 3-phosphate transport system substrate-binding protein
MTDRKHYAAAAAAALMALALGALPASAKVQLDYYFPAQVQGPIARDMEGLVKHFNEGQDQIQVRAIYTGTYQDTKVKAAAAAKAGHPPAVALMAENKASKAEFVADFWPALLPNATINGKLYGIPFQNSTPILYINADQFREAGLDPDHPPRDWAELVEAAKKLVKKDGDEVSRYGIMVPLNYNYLNWVLEGFVMSNGGMYFNPEYPGEVYYDQPTTRGAVQFYRDLAFKYGVMPKSVTSAKQISTNFLAGKTAMMVLSTGGLSFVRENVKFDYRVAFVPGKVRRAVPIGGGSLIVFKGLSDEQRAAAWKFVEWLASPEQLGNWSRISGYFSPRKSSYDLPEMKAFLEKHPDAKVAVEQLEYSQPWYSTYNTIAVARPLADAVQQIIQGKADVDKALGVAQLEAEKLLAPYVKATAYTGE